VKQTGGTCKSVPLVCSFSVPPSDGSEILILKTSGLYYEVENRTIGEITYTVTASNPKNLTRYTVGEKGYYGTGNSNLGEASIGLTITNANTEDCGLEFPETGRALKSVRPVLLCVSKRSGLPVYTRES